MQSKNDKGRVVFPVYLAFLLDNFGLAMAYPILTPLFLSPDYFVFHPNYSLANKVILLSLAIAAFPLAQFFGAPLIGEFSDRIGRKRSFVGTIGGTAVGYLITAFSIFSLSFPLLILGRLWTGFFAGNLTLCLAAIADVSPDESTRTKNFGKLASFGGISFVLGILVGSAFIDTGLQREIALSIPFWIITFLSIINLFLIYLFFQDQFLNKVSGKFNLLKGILNIASAFKEKKLRSIYLTYFFFITGWVTSMQFVSTFLLRIYNVDPTTLKITLVSVGFIWSMTNGLIAKRLHNFFRTSQVLLFSLTFIMLLLATAAFAKPLWLFLFVFGAAVLFGALAWTNCFCCVSMKGDEKIQGRLLGINQSIGALAAICGPVIGGFLSNFGIFWIYIFAAFCTFLSILFLLSEIKNNEIY